MLRLQIRNQVGRCVRLTLILVAFNQLMLAQSKADGLVAYVYQIKGSWRTGPQYTADLKLGQGLRNHERIRLNSKQRDASIRIGLVDGSVRVKDCRTDHEKCKIPFELSIHELESGYLARLQSIWNYLRNPREAGLIVTMSRGSEDEPALEESVLTLRDGKPDFTPILGDIPAGKLEIALTPASNGIKVFRHQVLWSPPQANVSGPKLLPGLYRLQILPRGGSTWVLLAAPEDAPHLRGILDDAKQMAAKWPAEMGDEARDLFLASVLATIRDSGRELRNGR